ncbi:unnamed protein product [Arctogadus glacialis]
MDELLSFIGPEVTRQTTNYRSAVEPKQRQAVALRWKILHRRINLHPQNVDTLVLAACILHNFLLSPRENVRLLEEAEQQGRNLPAVRNMGGNRASREACNVREIFYTYFNSPQGSVSWQDRMV